MSHWIVGDLLPGGELRVWLDDLLVDRAAPEGWIHVTTVPTAIALLHTGRVVALSFDSGPDGEEVSVTELEAPERRSSRRNRFESAMPPGAAEIARDLGTSGKHIAISGGFLPAGARALAPKVALCSGAVARRASAAPSVSRGGEPSERRTSRTAHSRRRPGTIGDHSQARQRAGGPVRRPRPELVCRALCRASPGARHLRL